MRLSSRWACAQGRVEWPFTSRGLRPPDLIRQPLDWGRLRQKTGLLVPLGVRRQGYSTYEMQVDGPPIWGMSAKYSSYKLDLSSSAIHDNWSYVELGRRNNSV